MKLRDKILYMSFGAGLVVLGMVLNSLVSGDAEAQGGGKDAIFRNITCEGILVKGLVIADENGRWRGTFGLDTDGDATLKIYGDDGKTDVAYLGINPADNNEIAFSISSKSNTDKREVSMMIDRNGGRLDCHNKMGENVRLLFSSLILLVLLI